jgi:hypothetical protein
MKLTDTEIRQRLIRLRNVERLYKEQKVQLQVVRAENKELKARIIYLEAENAELKRTIQDMSLRMEELTIMIFGKKKHKKHEDNDHKKPPTPRTPESYKRPLPHEDEVTGRKTYTLSVCTHCSGEITKRTTTTFYVEDIPLPQKKDVIKHTVEKGYCTSCKKWNAGACIPSARVILGNRVQAYIVYLSVMARLSFTQIRQLLYDTYSFSISDGEIAKILNRQALVYRPEYEQLKEELREEPVVHLDETGWRQLKDSSKSHAWSMSTPNGKTLFLVGESRGKGNVETLLGSAYSGIVVSDDYGAYKKLVRHQLCWAHILRKFRDLANSEEMHTEVKVHHVALYQKLASLYQSVRDHRDISLLAKYTQKLKAFTSILQQDCKKARTFKNTLLKNIPAYLICLAGEYIPMTNNQAERSLRHLVLKRKISFGSYSKRTADCLAVLLSVFMSRRNANPRDWFGAVLAGV